MSKTPAAAEKALPPNSAALPDAGANFFEADFFALFGLPPRFDVNEEELAERYRALQQKTHPDRFAAASAVERRLAANLTGRVNDAYNTLQNPLRRAVYLLQLHGEDPFSETNTAMPPDFLERQIELREALTEAEGDKNALAALLQKAREEEARVAKQTRAALAAQDWQEAAQAARQWRYLAKLAQETSATFDAAAN
jgi:molecular chaperone HscB